MEPEDRDEFAKGPTAANDSGLRPADAAAKPLDDGDDWYVRTGQPAPQRAEEGEEAPGAVEPPSAAQKQAMILAGVIGVVFLLIVVFGVFLA